MGPMKVRSLFVVRLTTLAVLCLLTIAILSAQKVKRDPLTEAEVDKIREAGIDPGERIKIYAKIVEDHVSTVKGLTNRGRSPARAKRLDDELQDLTALMDELGTNLDTYTDRHADIRAALKPLAEATQRWLGNLRALAGEPG